MQQSLGRVKGEETCDPRESDGPHDQKFDVVLLDVFHDRKVRWVGDDVNLWLLDKLVSFREVNPHQYVLEYFMACLIR